MTVAKSADHIPWPSTLGILQVQRVYCLVYKISLHCLRSLWILPHIHNIIIIIIASKSTRCVQINILYGRVFVCVCVIV